MEPKRGAEAIVTFEGDTVVKERLSKGYRHPRIDAKLISDRTKREAKVLERLSEIDGVPRLVSSDGPTLTIGYVSGPTFDEAPDIERAGELAQSLHSIHALGVSHGDVSPKNVIVSERLSLIDFGLAEFTDRIEDYAMDLSMTQETFSSYPGFFEALLDEYLRLLDEDRRRLFSDRISAIKSRGRHKKKNR